MVVNDIIILGMLSLHTFVSTLLLYWNVIILVFPTLICLDNNHIIVLLLLLCYTQCRSLSFLPNPNPSDRVKYTVSRTYTIRDGIKYTDRCTRLIKKIFFFLSVRIILSRAIKKICIQSVSRGLYIFRYDNVKMSIILLTHSVYK